MIWSFLLQFVFVERFTECSFSRHEHYDTNLAMFGRYFLKEMENIFEQNLILFQCVLKACKGTELANR